MKHMLTMAIPVLLLLAAPARAYTLLGGKTLGVTESAIHVQAGYPELSFSYHIPILKTFEVAPQASIYYGHGAFDAFSPGVLGNSFGALLRWQLVSKEHFHLAYRASPALFVTYVGAGDTIVGFDLGAPGGLQFDWEISQEVNLIAGFDIPFVVPVSPGAALVVPIDTLLGVEVELTKQVTLSVALEAGPSVIKVQNTQSHVGASFRALVGVEYLL